MVSYRSKLNCFSCKKPGNNSCKLSEVKTEDVRNLFQCSFGDYACKKCRDKKYFNPTGNL